MYTRLWESIQYVIRDTALLQACGISGASQHCHVTSPGIRLALTVSSHSAELATVSDRLSLRAGLQVGTGLPIDIAPMPCVSNQPKTRDSVVPRTTSAHVLSRQDRRITFQAMNIPLQYCIVWRG